VIYRFTTFELDTERVELRQAGEVAAAEQGPANSTSAVAGSDANTTGERRLSRPAIAVLPFVNLSGDDEQEYFSDAITQDIITSLSKHRWLDVVARNSSFGFKGKSVDVRQIGRELGVSYIVEGSVRRSGNRIRVTAQLVDSISGKQRWSDQYDGDLEDVFAVQDEITAKIVARLEPEIGAAERRKVVRSPRRDLQAWECYHLGVYHFFKFTTGDNLEAQRLLQQSRELDPQRWAFLTYRALAHIFKGDFDNAVKWAERAGEIPNCQYWTTAHKAVALAHLGDRDRARRSVSLLLEERPDFSQAFARKKLFYLKDPQQLQTYLEGLALAGVPEA